MTLGWRARFGFVTRKLAGKWQTLTDHLISSPCTGVCQMDKDNRYCTGCYRTMAEICNWSRFSGDEKHAINAAVLQRKTAAGSDNKLNKAI